MQKMQAQTQARMSEMVAQFKMEMEKQQADLMKNLTLQTNQAQLDNQQSLTDHEMKLAQQRAQKETRTGSPNA